MNLSVTDLFSQIQAASKLAVGAVPKGLITTLAPHRWDHVSVNGKQVAEVTEHGMSFDAAHQLAKVHWTFADLSNRSRVQTISATFDVHGRTTIALDDDAQGPDDPVTEAAPRIAGRFIVMFEAVKISIELIFDLKGQRQDYRFDGRMYP